MLGAPCSFHGSKWINREDMGEGQDSQLETSRHVYQCHLNAILLYLLLYAKYLLLSLAMSTVVGTRKGFRVWSVSLYWSGYRNVP